MFICLNIYCLSLTASVSIFICNFTGACVRTDLFVYFYQMKVYISSYIRLYCIHIYVFRQSGCVGILMVDDIGDGIGEPSSSSGWDKVCSLFVAKVQIAGQTGLLIPGWIKIIAVLRIDGKCFGSKTWISKPVRHFLQPCSNNSRDDTGAAGFLLCPWSTFEEQTDEIFKTMVVRD